MVWEALFFTAAANPRNYAASQRAENFLLNNSSVAFHLDIDRCIGRANKLNTEEVYRDLLEICLRFDLEYEKQRAFEALLMFQCQRGLLETARATFNSSQDHGVRYVTKTKFGERGSVVANDVYFSGWARRF